MDSKTSELNQKLEKLGLELTKIQYDFKIKDIPSQKYWEERIEEFNTYHKKTIDYFSHAYFLMRKADNEKANLFILRLSKLQELGKTLIENMEKIKQNPSIVNLKDRQQSRWSIEQRESLINSNIECLEHEKKMNVFFKEFFEKNLN